MGESITEQEQVEWALRENGEKYRELAESITDVFFAMDGDLRYTYWNKASEELTGIKAEDALGKSIFEIFPDRKDTRRSVAIYQKVLKTQQPQSFVNEYQLGGKDFFFEISAYPTRGGLSVFVKDITERNKAEEALKERIKELNGLYGLGRLTVQVKNLDVLFNRFTKEVAPESTQFPEKCHVGIKINGKEYCNCEKHCVGDIKYNLSAPIKVKGKERGKLTIGYLEDLPFIEKFEQNLVDGYAERLGKIIERFEAEQVLRESEERFRQFFENEPEYCYMISPKGKILDVNKSALKTLGYKKEETIGKPLLTTIYAPSSHEKAKKLFMKWKKAGKLRNEELNIITKSGEERTILLSADAVKNADGKIIHSISIQRDISERKKAEEKIKESEEKYRLLIENSGSSIMALDKNGVHLALNSLAAESLGGKPEDFIGKSMYDIFPKNFADKHIKRYNHVIKSGVGKTFEDLVPLPSGEQRLYSSNIQPIKKPNDDILGVQIISHDITERRKAEKEIKYLKEYNENILESNPNPIIVTKGNQIEYVNKSFISTFGKTKDDYISKDLSEVIPSEAIPAFEELLKDNDKIKELEIKGKSFSISSFVVKKAEEEEEEERIGIILQDITERKKTEEALRESEEKFRTFVDTASDLMDITDKDGTFTDVNEAMAKTLGYSKEELIGMRITQILTKEALENDFKPNWEKFVTNGEMNIETTLATKNGKEICGELKVVAIYGSDGKFAGGRSVFHDITERKKAEERIKESEEKWRSLVKNAPNVIMTLDRKGTILFINHTVSGFAPDQVIGKNQYDFINPEYVEVAKGTIEQVFKTGNPGKYEIQGAGPNGTISWYRTHVGPIKQGGKIVAVTLVTDDITKRKKAEEEIIRTKEYLQNIIDSASEIIISFDTNNRVTTWNNTAEFITGYKQRGIIGRQIHKLNVFDNPSEIADYIKSICDGHKAKFDELILRTKDGAKRIIRVSSSAIMDDKGHCNGILFIGKDITHDREAHGRLLKGNSYLIVDKNNRYALDLFVDLTKSDYNGLFITRANPEMIKDMISSTDIQTKLLNQDKLGGFEHISDFDGLIAAVKDFSTENTDSVILLDRIDYFITRFSFERFTESLYQINSVISKNNSILLVYLNPSFLDTRQMAFIEAELQPLPGQKIEGIEIEDELFDILRFIYEQNQNNLLVSFKKISRKFSIVRSTAAKRLRMLEDTGLVSIKKQGKLKTARVSDKGKTLLNKRQAV